MLGRWVSWGSGDGRPDRRVLGVCQSCRRSAYIAGYHAPDIDDPRVVSPTGLVHDAREHDGVTVCGLDATGPAWWWAE